MSSKSVNAVVPEVDGVTFVNTPPPAEYEPDAETSLEVVYAVVAAVNVVQRDLKLIVSVCKIVTSCKQFLLKRRTHEVSAESHFKVSL